MKDFERNGKRLAVRGAKECAYLAVFVALVIAVQLCLAVVPGVELVTVLFVSYAFVFGIKRGLISATAFSILRQLLFGFSPTVLILYLVYYNALALAFGCIGRAVKDPLRALWWIVLTACVCTLCFSMLDNIITPLCYGYTKRATRAYFIASLSFMFPQLVCTAVSVGILFIPLQRAFKSIKKGL